MIDGGSDRPDSDGQVDAALKRKFVRGVLFFYIVNLVGLWIGVIGVKVFGNLEGIVILLGALAVLQGGAGYLTLKFSDRIVGGEDS